MCGSPIDKLKDHSLDALIGLKHDHAKVDVIVISMCIRVHCADIHRFDSVKVRLTSILASRIDCNALEAC